MLDSIKFLKSWNIRLKNVYLVLCAKALQVKDSISCLRFISYLGEKKNTAYHLLGPQGLCWKFQIQENNKMMNSEHTEMAALWQTSREELQGDCWTSCCSRAGGRTTSVCSPITSRPDIYLLLTLSLSLCVSVSLSQRRRMLVEGGAVTQSL